MPAPVSLDLRLRIVRAVAQGSSIRAAARRFAASPSAAIKLADLARLVATAPDITLAELQAALQRRFGSIVGLSTTHNTRRRIGLRHNKGP